MPCKISLLMLTAASVLTLSACGSSSTPTATETAPASPTAEATPATTATTATSEPTAAASPQNGGQVVEMGEYHLELIAAPEGEGLHVDFWLLTGSDHATVDDAKVTANIQFPDGTEKTVDLTYDEAASHYKALVPGFVAGEYRIVVQTETNGEKVNGRFNFSL